MADIQRIRAVIAEIAKRRHNVQLAEIQWVVRVVTQLKQNGYEVSSRTNAHQHLFRVNGRRFGVCHHNPGSKPIKACCANEFLDRMADLGSMKTEKAKNLAYYLGLPYTIVLRRDEDDDYVARIPELPGCIAHGKTEGEAVAEVREMQRLWLEDALSTGEQIPEPETDADLPSGKWVQRAPRTLHKALADQARKDNVSLNQLVTSLLSRALTERSCIDAFQAAIAKKFYSAPSIHPSKVSGVKSAGKGRFTGTD